MKSEHLKWFTEMAKTLQFKVTEIELSDEEEAKEDACLIAAMEEVKDEPNATADEIAEFKK